MATTKILLSVDLSLDRCRKSG